MSDSLIDKYSKRPPSQLAEHAEPETDDLGCFGWLRGVRDRAIMLELRKKDGHVLAVGYAWIERMEYQPEEGIVLYLPGRQITLRGTSLNAVPEHRSGASLFAGLIQHRVPWIREIDSNKSLSTTNSSVSVDSIRWEE